MAPQWPDSKINKYEIVHRCVIQCLVMKDCNICWDDWYNWFDWEDWDDWGDLDYWDNWDVWDI